MMLIHGSVRLHVSGSKNHSIALTPLPLLFLTNKGPGHCRLSVTVSSWEELFLSSRMRSLWLSSASASHRVLSPHLCVPKQKVYRWRNRVRSRENGANAVKNLFSWGLCASRLLKARSRWKIKLHVCVAITWFVLWRCGFILLVLCPACRGEAVLNGQLLHAGVNHQVRDSVIVFTLNGAPCWPDPSMPRWNAEETIHHIRESCRNWTALMQTDSLTDLLFFGVNFKLNMHRCFVFRIINPNTSTAPRPINDPAVMLV